MLTIREAKQLPIGVYKIERGVYLRVEEKTRRFIFKCMRRGHRLELGLGPVEGQTISGVLGKAAQYRTAIEAGEPPVAEKPEIGRLLRIPTFDEYVGGAIKRIAFLRQWKNAKHGQQWVNTVNTYAVPVLGNKRLDKITGEDIYQVLRPIWQVKTETAQRLQERLNIIFALAIQDKYVEKNPATWEENLSAKLPAASRLLRVRTKHHAAVSAEELREIVARLRQIDHVTAKLILFGILTVGRLSEYSKSQWSEIDFRTNTLSVPYDRRKDNKAEPFVVPLSRQAQQVISEVPRDDDYIFSIYPGTPISQSTVLKCLRKCTTKPITMHGMRSTFSDWCAQHNKNFLVSEKCLMHQVGGKVFCAYQRDDLLEQRHELLQEWADWLYEKE